VAAYSTLRSKVLSVDDQIARLVLVGILSIMAVGGTFVALVATWRNWRRGLAVEGISLFLAMVCLSLIGLVPLVVLASLVGALVAVVVGRRRRREPEERAPWKDVELL
jgi:uncharacterized membrane protein